MPPGIGYIIGNEAAERFSFYGMKTILVVFMANYLHLMGAGAGNAMSETAATEKAHLFNAAVYFTPFLGALLADAYLGKYRTIIYLSLVYCAGHAALAFMGVAGEASHWLLAGLILISLGSGGIKPCVSAHVGDQFGKSNANLMTRAFNFFYVSINFGSFFSTLLTPWLLLWYGPHIAFGIPGVLMAVATLLFWMGRKKFVHIPARGNSFFSELSSPTGLAACAKLMVIFIFVAFFWMLFDQTGSSWVFQARDMDRNWLGIEWLPAQIQALNPLLILILVPIFVFFVYPAIDKVFKLTPMRKIGLGLFVAVAAFAIIALAQERIDAGEKPSIGWQVVAFLVLTSAEVMVSIVALEFAYTQAPKSMKSVIVALFLWSVTLGNLITAGVNNVIQIPSYETEIVAPEGGGSATGDGFDGKAGTPDDVEILFSAAGKREEVKFAGRDSIDEAVGRIEAASAEAIPRTEEGQKLIGDLLDPQGNPLRYRQTSSTQFRISSDGPDGEPKTKWDLGAIVDLKVETSDRTLFDMFVEAIGMEMPEKNWLELRKEELAVAEEKEEDPEAKAERFDRTYYAGGLTKLEGASYFWFFTYLMLGAALVFVIVAKLYRPRFYYQDEDTHEDDAEAASEMR